MGVSQQQGGGTTFPPPSVPDWALGLAGGVDGPLGFRLCLRERIWRNQWQPLPLRSLTRAPSLVVRVDDPLELRPLLEVLQGGAARLVPVPVVDGPPFGRLKTSREAKAWNPPLKGKKYNIHPEGKF